MPLRPLGRRLGGRGRCALLACPLLGRRPLGRRLGGRGRCTLLACPLLGRRPLGSSPSHLSLLRESVGADLPRHELLLVLCVPRELHLGFGQKLARPEPLLLLLHPGQLFRQGLIRTHPRKPLALALDLVLLARRVGFVRRIRASLVDKRGAVAVPGFLARPLGHGL